MGINLTGKTVVITGASSGIGRAAALAFAEVGCKLVLLARRKERLVELAQEIESKFGVSTFTEVLDVSSSQQVIEVVSKIPASFQPISVLINNAGGAHGLDTAQTASIADWDQMIDTNVKGLMYVTHAVLPQMLEKNSGQIINIGSIAGHRAYKGGAAYCAAKHAVNAFTRALKKDVEGSRVRISSVDPGAVETEFSLVRFKGDSTKAKAVYENMEPLTPEDIAEILVFCATRPERVNICETLVLATDQVSLW